MTVVSMSNQEFSRLQVLLDVKSGRLRIEDAAQLIGLKRRQVFRLLKGIREDGPAGLISTEVALATVGCRLHTENWQWRLFVNDMRTLDRRWRLRS